MESGVAKTKNYYDGIARGYSELYHKEQEKKISLAKNFFPFSGDGLDLGSGDGVLNQFLESQVNLVSVDLSFELLKLNSNTNKINASILSLPFKQNSFDFIFSFTVIQDVPNIESSIEEISRILKPKGKLFLSFLKMSSKKDSILHSLKKKFLFLKQIKEEKDIIIIAQKK